MSGYALEGSILLYPDTAARVEQLDEELRKTYGPSPTSHPSAICFVEEDPYWHRIVRSMGEPYKRLASTTPVTYSQTNTQQLPLPTTQ